MTLAPHIASARILLPCRDLPALLAFLTETVGLQLERIFPAEEPAVADLRGFGLALRLSTQEPVSGAPPILQLLCDRSALPAGTAEVLHGPEGWQVRLLHSSISIEVPEGHQSFVISRLPAATASARYEGPAWTVGRAGMRYRDLLPDRYDGRFVASHIAIVEGGVVPDYVHYHHVRFQMIYCLAGWVRLVYEDQGEPFILNAGDCVLQPPTIRHRVLEASAGLEVLEIGCPAVHETCVDANLVLPNGAARLGRQYGGQHFVRHVEADSAARWRPADSTIGAEACDLGITAATSGLARVHAVRASAGYRAQARHKGEFRLLYLREGSLSLQHATLGQHTLGAGDCVTMPAGEEFTVHSDEGFVAVEVSL
ncbi:MAG: cupin domain-containing protein [Nevskiaceae bacterium]